MHRTRRKTLILKTSPLPPPPLPSCFPTATSGLESPAYGRAPIADDLANQMGLFLQKTNIIRDYLVSAVVGGGD